MECEYCEALGMLKAETQELLLILAEARGERAQRAAVKSLQTAMACLEVHKHLHVVKGLELQSH